MNSNQIREIGVAGLLHDIGKTKVPTNILNKPGKLNNQEFEIMKQHSLFGYQMVKDRPDVSEEVSLTILEHHEKINGSGYPMGITLAQICPYARILTISDICSMMASSLKICFISVSDSLHTTCQKASSKGLKTYLFSLRTGKAPPKRGFLFNKIEPTF